MRFDILCKPESGRRCKLTFENVRQALETSGVEAEVHLFRDYRKMIDNRVYVSPALVVDDVVRVAGRVPSVEEILDILSEHPRYRRRSTEVA